MATITSFINFGGNAAIPVESIKKAFVLKNVLDFALTPVLAGDVVQALNVPAQTIVLNVFVKVITAEGGASTATVGDGTAAAGWDGATDLNAAANTITAGIQGTDAFFAANTTGKIYEAADTIDLVMGHNTDAGKIEVFAICFDLS